MKRAFVLGASGAIGGKCALELLKMGYAVIAHHNSTPISPATFVGFEDRVMVVKADLGSLAEVDALNPYLKSADILVCAAGITHYALAQHTTLKDFERVLKINLISAHQAASLAIPAMIERGEGRIVFISSIWGQSGAAMESAYSASKAALHGLTKSLAKELGASNITVNAVAAGVIDTPMNAAFSSQEMAELAALTPLARLGTAQDVANLVAFLCSPQASFITGQIIACDGGISIS